MHHNAAGREKDLDGGDVETKFARLCIRQKCTRHQAATVKTSRQADDSWEAAHPSGKDRTSTFVLKPLFGDLRPSDIPLAKWPQPPSPSDVEKMTPSPSRAVIVKGWVHLDQDYGQHNLAVTPQDVAETLAHSLTDKSLKMHVAASTKQSTRKKGNKWHTDYFLWVVPGTTVDGAPAAGSPEELRLLQNLYVDIHLLVASWVWLAESTNPHRERVCFALPTTNLMNACNEVVIGFLAPNHYGANSLTCAWHAGQLYDAVNDTLPSLLQFAPEWDFCCQVGL